jgi:hypothetical protein
MKMNTIYLNRPHGLILSLLLRHRSSSADDLGAMGGFEKNPMSAMIESGILLPAELAGHKGKDAHIRDFTAQG